MQLIAVNIALSMGALDVPTVTAAAAVRLLIDVLDDVRGIGIEKALGAMQINILKKQIAVSYQVKVQLLVATDAARLKRAIAAVFLLDRVFT